MRSAIRGALYISHVNYHDELIDSARDVVIKLKKLFISKGALSHTTMKQSNMNGNDWRVTRWNTP
jgi:hypothetical protein